MIKRFCWILFLIPAYSLTAQLPGMPIICGNEIYSANLRQHYPALYDNIESTFEAALRSTTYRHAEPLTIHMVVHVVWKEDEENLADSIILDQIRVMNEDFNRMNADSSNLRSRFKPEAGTANIHFELAEIVRVHTDVLFEIGLTDVNLLTEAKHTADGGSDAWDPTQYLNVWVCKIQPITIFGIEIGQVLGFAFPPANLPNWPADSNAPSPEEDGVVIDYRVFGSNNPNEVQNPDGSGAIVVKGRTPVHEVGHYLGLRHIWGDGGLLGPNDCAQSDGIHDTPFANAQSAFDCDTLKNTCPQIEDYYQTDMPDLIENYMDYASEDCMNMFTRGQVELMRNVLLGPRSGLLMPFSSVVDEEHSMACRVYPNPSNGPFTIEWEITTPGKTSVRIINLHGQVAFEKAPEHYLPGHQHLVIDHSLSPGAIYFVEIRNETSIFIQKLMVN